MSAPIKVNEEFSVRGVQHRVLRIMKGRVLLENTATTETREVAADDLLDLYRTGDLIISDRIAQGSIQPLQDRPTATLDMERLGEKGRKATVRRSKWLTALDRVRAFGSRTRLAKAVEHLASELKELKAPSLSSLYRWHGNWLQSQKDPRSLMARFDRRGGRNKYRMEPEVEALIAKYAEEIYLGQRRASAGEVQRAVALAVAEENKRRIPSERLREPSLRTVQSRMARLYAFDVSMARTGPRATKSKYGDSVAARLTERILEVVEIDHTPIDLWVVNEQGGLAGKPMLTLLLDRYSRCVLGLFLSLTGHGVDSVFGALRHALLPKTYLRKRYPEVQGTWPCYGRFTTLLADNGSELVGKSLESAAFDLRINFELCGSMTPNDKPHIERFFYTFNHRFIHTLKGTSLARVSAREGEQLQNDACLTLAELERVIHVWIVDVYHARPHEGLDGRTPADVWAESAQRFPPGIDLNLTQIDAALSEVAMRSHPRIEMHDRTLIPVLLANMPATPTQRKILEALIAAMDPELPAKGSIKDLKTQLLTLCDACGVSLVLLDEASHMVDRGQERTHYLVGDALKEVVDFLGRPFVLAGIPRLKRLLEVNEQLRGRFNRCRTLKPFSLSVKESAADFRGAVQAFSNELLGIEAVDLSGEGVLPQLFMATNGLLKPLVELLKDAVDLAMCTSRPAIKLDTLAAAFRSALWEEAPPERNPFEKGFNGYPLIKPGEPYAVPERD